VTVALNPNWPVLEEAWGPYWNASTALTPLDRFTEVTPTTTSKSDSKRGRQYELDQIQPGTASTVLTNTTGSLDPANVAGPFYGHIQPFQPVRRRAMWPPSINLLSQVMATGGDLGGYAVGSSVVNGNVFSDTDPTGSGIVAASGTAYQGSNVLQFSVPSGSAVGARICATAEPAAQPGQTYTMQMRIRNITPSTTLQVKSGQGWYLTPLAPGTSYTYGSTVTLTGSATAAWTQIAVTATAAAGVLGMVVGAMVAATAAATCTIQVDAWQLEKGATASAWSQPGVWYPMYVGYTTQWKPAFSGNQFSTITPNSVDAFSLLARCILDDPLTEALSAAGARFVYRLDEGSGATQFADATGANGVTGIINSKNGAGSISPGTQITATDPINGVFTGTGTVTTFANPSPGQGAGFPSSVISLPTAGIAGPSNPAAWTRCVAFRYGGPTPTDAACIWSSMDRQHAATGTVATGSRIFLSIFTDGHLHLVIGGPSGTAVNMTFTHNDGTIPTVVDGNWHLAVFGWNQSTGEARVSIDGNEWFYTGLPSTITPTGLVSDSIGAWYDVGLGGAAGNNWQGDLAFVCEFTSYLFNNNTDAIYAAWKNSFMGESTNARYARILQYAGSTALWNLQAGLTTSMGPANFGGQDAFTALQAVVETENGEHFVGADGRIVFRSRGARYNATTPIWVFGDGPGELPYEGMDPDYDTTHLGNVATVSQVSPASKFTAQDATSVSAYGPQTMTRTINSTSAQECQDAASYLVSRYKQPTYRVATMKLHPSANVTLWPVLLGLELGTRVRVMKRPFGAPPIQIDCFVESIQWDLSDQNEAFCTLQCSPADLTPYGLFAAWHTTLKTTVASGVSSITVNNSQDNVNPLAAQLPGGSQLVLGLGTANQETVTVQAVGATSTGWTSAVITFTGNTTKSHTANDVICEALPAGVTDATTWDAVSAFDASAFAY
jgi:hypothetical protein